MKETHESSFQCGNWTIESKGVKLSMHIVYHPPNSAKNQPNSVFLDEFTEYLANLTMQRSCKIILGDINMHLNNLEDEDAETFRDTVYSLGMDQHVGFATHRAGNTLDVVITETGSNIKVQSCRPGPYISDHRAVEVVTNIPREDIQIKSVTVRKLKNIDVDKMVESMDLASVCLEEMDDLNKIVDLVETRMKNALDLHAPMKTQNMTVRKLTPWYTEEVKGQKRLMRKQERIWRKSKTDDTWKAFDVERRKYNTMLAEAKITSTSEKIQECRGDSKKLYGLVAELTGKIKENPMPEKKDGELAEEFAGFFLGKIQKIRDSLANHPKFNPTRSEVKQISCFTQMSEEDITQIIKSMATKSCETDALPTKVLKQILPQIIATICVLVNKSMELGVFPEKWKVAVIRPLLKKIGLELSISNYRPVSNLPFLSKVLEKAVLVQFDKHCKDEDLMPDYQSAYRRFYSCETALVKLTNDILWAMEHQNVTSLMMIDLSAAFDTVDHDILLTVLERKFGVTGKCLSWFESYLRPRSCKVNVGSTYSTMMDLAFSVPQGSCAGPILYLAYASTLQDTIKQPLSLYGYADDHAVKDSFKASSRKMEESSVKRIEECAVGIRQWMDVNRLQMNDSKTEFIMFGGAQQLKKCIATSINVNGTIVEKSTVVKYLGVYLDSCLTMKTHISNKCRIAMCNIQRIRHIRKSLTRDACVILMLGLVMSHLDFANALYAGLPDVSIKKLQRIQNIAAKVVLNKRKYDSATACLKELHWLPIKSRVTFKILTLVYQCVKGDAPKYLQDMMVKAVPGREGLRSNSDIHKLDPPFARLKTFAARSFSVNGPKEWNKLPSDIKEAENVDTFKAKLKTHLFSLAFK